SLVSVAGFLLEKEIKYLGESLKNPRTPFVAILGGSKVSDKIGVIENILPKTETIIIGGAMAYTFLKVQGINTGSSKIEKEKLDLAREILAKAKGMNKEIVLPVDHIIADKPSAGAKIKITQDVSIEDGWFGVDIGPKTQKLFKDILKTAQTVIWNGPLGIFEIDEFSQGTKEIAMFLSGIKATTIVGGGDTAAAVTKFGVEGKITHVSTGGGASLEYMEGKELPGIVALTDK
ncbi:MAG: phosphoglycerate kinase, partial [Candidatus Omnitrophica bacterium]|nr:phosphoglycerate kinase [Candidatus Omnitrophota bacterium]